MDALLYSVKRQCMMMFLPLLAIGVIGLWLFRMEDGFVASEAVLTAWYFFLALIFLELRFLGMGSQVCIWFAALSFLWGICAGMPSIIPLFLFPLLLWKKEGQDWPPKAVIIGMALAVPACIREPVRFTLSLYLLAGVLYSASRKMAAIHEEKHRALYETELLTELNRLKNQSYAEMSHEMKTPLTVISVNAQLAAMNLETGILDEETITDIKIISKEASRLTQMVTSLVEFGQLQGTGVGRTLLSPDALVRTTVRTCQTLTARYGNSLTVDSEPDLPQIVGNTDHLAQVLINLISNANRHTRNGSITISLKEQAGWIEVTVTDNGEGITPELLPHVFERFRHGDRGDTGLGLFICKKIMDEHDGKIGIESEAGKGTRVWFTLPVFQNEQRNKDKSAKLTKMGSA